MTVFGQPSPHPFADDFGLEQHAPATDHSAGDIARGVQASQRTDTQAGQVRQLGHVDE